MEDYEGTYEVDDGYAGGARPKYFTVSAFDIEDDAADEDLEQLYYDCMQEAFENDVSPYSKGNDLERFMEWARRKRDEMNED